MKQRGSFTLDAQLLERLKRASRKKNLPMSRLVEAAIEGWLSRERGRTVRAGVVGLGHWGEQHCRVISEIPGVELSAVCDSNPRKIAVGEKYNVEFYYSLEDFLALPLDLVFSCVGIERLAEVSQEVARLGINCVVEKPFGRSLDEVKELAGYSNAIPELVELTNGAYKSLKENLNMLDRLYGSASIRAGTMPRRDLGVDCMWYLAPYDFAIAHELFGMPREVVSRSNRDYAYVFFHYGDVTSQFYFDWRVPSKIRRLTVFGENGALESDLVSMESRFNNLPLKVNTQEPLKNYIASLVEEGEKVGMKEMYDLLKKVSEG